MFYHLIKFNCLHSSTFLFFLNVRVSQCKWTKVRIIIKSIISHCCICIQVMKLQIYHIYRTMTPSVIRGLCEQPCSNNYVVSQPWYNNLTPPQSRRFSTHLRNTSYCTNICFSLHTSSSESENLFGYGSMTQPWWVQERIPLLRAQRVTQLLWGGHKKDFHRCARLALPLP